MKTRQLFFRGIFWIALYLLLSIAPLLIILIGLRSPGREFWRELSTGLGFVGLAMMTLQFVLTARFKTLKAPCSSDVVYYFHRQISLVEFLLVLLHPILLFIYALIRCACSMFSVLHGGHGRGWFRWLR